MSGEPSAAERRAQTGASGSGILRAVRHVIDWILPAESADRVVYGLILVGALFAAESGTHETYLDTFLSAAIVTAIFWLAHSYADVLARRLTSSERLTLGALGRVLAAQAGLLRGAAVPMVVLVVAWLGGASQEDAVNAALWSTVAALICFEFAAAARAPATLAERALELGVGAAIGLGILALKIILH